MPETVAQRIERLAAVYAELPVFRALRDDRVPLERFPAFFREQAVAARFFQDLIWAGTAVEDETLGGFARSHRAVDSGHWRWSEEDLVASGLRPLSLDDCFALEFLETRIQMARMLALFHDASPKHRLLALLALETAGTITLGTLFGYVRRHGLEDKLQYLGHPHVRIEANQAAAIGSHLADLLQGSDPSSLALVETVFDALGCMFTRGGRRHWPDLLDA